MVSDSFKGYQALTRGELGEAEAIFSARLRHDPTDKFSLRGLALICIERNNVEYARELLTTILLRHPDFIEARCDLARIFLSRAQYHDVLDLLDLNFSHIKDRSEVCLLRGNALRALGRFAEALESYERGYSRAHHVEFSINRANVLSDLKRFDEAEQLIDAVVEANPTNSHALFNASLLHLRLGRWAAGWPLQEKRPRKKSIDRGWRLGELSKAIVNAMVEGITPNVLLYSEQGLGDVLQYLRFLRHPCFKGCRLTVQVPAALQALVQLNFPGISVKIDLPVLQEEFDIRCSLLSLPAALGLRSERELASEPYFSAPTSRAAELQAAVRGAEARPCVGIEWRGGGNPRLANRSMPINSLASLLKPEIRFMSLRQNPNAEECGWLDTHGIIRLDSCMMSFIDTAAVIQNLDVVVTIDTSIAHLSGAMGVRTLLLLPCSAAWVWMERRSDSPWYSSVTLIRQPTPGDWASCIATAARLL